jgi:hypothetical protein
MPLFLLFYGGSVFAQAFYNYKQEMRRCALWTFVVKYSYTNALLTLLPAEKET